MPHIDGHTGAIVMRIVYDGAPEAGKTTNVLQLAESISLQRRGKVFSPGSAGRRTEFFDWMDFSGGYVDGRRVRCQVVSVPGQPELLRRRRYLIDSADAIIFVADSQPAGLEPSRHDFALLRRALARRQATTPVGVLVQANKQDLAEAIAPAELAAALCPDGAVPVVAARAQEGEGVMQAFVMAVRLATDRLRELLLGGELTETPDVAGSAEALHAALAALEPEAAPAEGPPTDAPRAPELPRVSAVASGSLWPTIKGRETLLSVDRASLRPHRAPVSWAPPGALELGTADGWVFHTCDHWRYESDADARRYLIELVRRLLALERFVPPRRTLFVGPDADAWRLWMQTPRVDTLADRLAAACDREDEDELAAAMEETSRVAGALSDVAVPSELIALDKLTVTRYGPALLALPEPLAASAAASAPRVSAHLVDEARCLVRRILDARPELRVTLGRWVVGP